MRCMILALCLSSALSLSVLPFASAQDDLPNLIKNSKIGAKALYIYQLNSPRRTDVGQLEVKLTNRDGQQYQIEEILTQGGAGFTKNTVSYPLHGNMREQIEAVYGAKFQEFRIISSTLVGDTTIEVASRTLNCKHLHLVFEGVNQTKRVKGDLHFMISPQAGPLGIAEFTSVISYETLPGRYGLSQTLNLKLTVVE